MKNFNPTQVAMIDETINTGVQTILDTFSELPQISQQFLGALSALNRHSQLGGLMPENKHPIFEAAGNELMDILFSRDYRESLAGMRPLFYLCGRQRTDHMIMFPLKRLQEHYGLSQTQHKELKTYIQEKLQATINDLKPHTQKRTRQDKQPHTNKRHHSAPGPKTKAAQPPTA